MAIERRLYAVPSQLLTANGQANGLISLPDSTLFKVKQVIFIASSTQSPVELEVKRVDDFTSIWIGPKSGPIDARFDAAAFLVADGAFIFANEQPRPGVPEQVIPRAVFEEEPALAIRSIAVDKLGNPWSAANPMPVHVDGLIIGTEDGTPSGVQHVFVNNLKSMILASHDRNRDVIYLDMASKKNRRVDKFEFTSPTFPGIILVREFNYDLVGTEYVFVNDNWNLI